MENQTTRLPFSPQGDTVRRQMSSSSTLPCPGFRPNRLWRQKGGSSHGWTPRSSRESEPELPSRQGDAPTLLGYEQNPVDSLCFQAPGDAIIPHFNSFSTAGEQNIEVYRENWNLGPAYNREHCHDLAALMKSRSSTAQILLFPSCQGDDLTTERAKETVQPPAICPTSFKVVLSGSYRRDPDGLRDTFQELRDLGYQLLSPTNVDITKEENGFVYMRGEEAELPSTIESRHLDSIEQAHFVWLHAPDGYVGTSAALEIGFANAIGIPVFAREAPSDPVMRTFVQILPSPHSVISRSDSAVLAVPAPPVRAFQVYYRRVASQRGYERENAQDCLTLMMEEIGELARAIRKRRHIAKHGRPHVEVDEAQELADVFLYVTHMANILNIDLSKAVRAKELANWKRFLQG